MKPIRKVVIPVAGLGTRVLPATKSIPKELLPVVDRPLIDYVVAEAREAGIEQFVFVTGRGKSAIEDYFDHAFELEAALKAKGKDALVAASTAAMPKAGEAIYTRQQSPLGLGHAVWCARHIVGDEPFAVSLPDEIVPGKPGYLAQLMDAHGKSGGNLVAVEEITRDETSKYGVIIPKGRRGDLIEMSGMIEKPAPAAAPSNFRIIGRYILEPAIFAVLERQPKGAGGEIQLTDAMNALNASAPFHALLCKGAIHDCGSKLGWLIANLDLGLAHPETGRSLADYARARLRG
jgi:UTP--glucose-1-phosphate uridylyltransferase